MTFESALWLWGIPLLALPSVFALFRFNRLKPGLSAFARAVPGSGRTLGRRFLLAESAMWLAGSCVLAALAGPRGSERLVAEQRVGLDLVFALDVSRSMDAEDLAPSRLARAVDLLLFAAATSPLSRTAVVLGKGGAVLALPLTDDSASLQALGASVSSDSLSIKGSNLEQLITTGVRAFAESSAARRLLIILSDGESLSGAPETAADELERLAVKTIFIGVGTTEGAVVPDGDGDFVRGDDGIAIRSRLQEAALRRLADQAGGIYLRGDAASVGTELAAIITAAAETTTTTDKRVESIDLYPYLLVLALFWYCVSRAVGYFGYGGGHS